MRRPVTTIAAGARVRDAAGLMREQGIRHLPVLDPGGRLVGIVTDRDLRQVIFDPAIQARLGASTEALEDLTVRDVMTWGVLTARPDSDLREAARVMHERKIGALPVVEGGAVVGMLTERDLLRALREMLRLRVTTVRPIAGPPPGGDPWDDAVPFPAAGDPWVDDGTAH